MKDSKFIELLNLYVDHQISSADAALLEAEIQRAPKRRRVYRQYCQMQKACVMLSENFRTQAQGPADGKVVEFPATNSRFAAVTYIMGVAAAAACVALVVVNRPIRQNMASPSPTVAAAVRHADAVGQTKAVAKPSVLPSVSRVALQPAFALVAKEDSVVNASLVSSNRVPLDWVNHVQLQSLPSENAWFESRSSFQPEDLTFRSSRAFEGHAEMMSFRFQK